jgi:carboxymethylenebutenolidase
VSAPGIEEAGYSRSLMCFDPRARPPPPPIAGGAGVLGTTDLVLHAEDGNRFAVFGALAAEPGAPGIVILPDVRGLHPFYRDLAVRFAEAGVHAAALDYFGRTAGLGDRGKDFDFMAHVQQTTPEGVAKDVAATIAHVRSSAGGGAERVFTVGFCFGGRHSFNQAARGHDLSGVIGFYGVPQRRDVGDTNAPVMLAPGYACPVLGLFGGADKASSREDVETFRHALEQAGVRNEIVTYEGAPHSFFDRTFEQYGDACDDAWRRMLSFVRGSPAS